MASVRTRSSRNWRGSSRFRAADDAQGRHGLRGGGTMPGRTRPSASAAGVSTAGQGRGHRDWRWARSSGNSVFRVRRWPTIWRASSAPAWSLRPAKGASSAAALHRSARRRSCRCWANAARDCRAFQPSFLRGTRMRLAQDAPMSTFVALLRAVDVGGTREACAKSPYLKRICEQAGLVGSGRTSRAAMLCSRASWPSRT